MAKKKKTQLKPVARGFATQSVPKKTIDAKSEDPDTEASVTPAEDIVTSPEASTSLTSGQTSTLHPLVGQDQFDPEQAEEQSLQNLVDKFQERTEKEIVRTLKAIEQDRRFAQTLPRFELEPSYVNQILELVKQPPTTEVKATIEEPEEKAIPRLAITYGVLRRLGYPEDVVDECLRSISGIDLEEAYEWLCIHLPEEELMREQGSIADNFGNSRISQSPQTTLSPSTPRTPSHEEVLPSKSSEKGGIVPQKLRLATTLEDDSDTDDPNASYVRLKMQITDLTTHRKPNEYRDASFLKTLQKRLEEVKQDYLFDELEAEKIYRAERERADAEALVSRLRQVELSRPPTPDPPAPQTPSQTQKDSSEPSGSGDIFDDEESLGGMFDILEELPATETTEEGTVIQIRDMSLPKHWAGRTPRILLSDIVRKLDRYAGIDFRTISGASRAKRAAVCVRWSQGGTSDWNMEDVACHDVSQAEQYISMIALHSLTFPTTEGFAVGGSSVAASPTFFRLLPPAYRDLWDELEQKRRTGDDCINRAVWAKLRVIIEPKLAERKEPTKTEKAALGTRKQASSRNFGQMGATPEQIMANFQARQASSAYQEMLYQRNGLPIAAYREQIIATLEASQVLVLSGETGCGKSTQVPSFIMEHQLSRELPCKIFCTEPRRISAISLAGRVSRELGEPAGAVGTLGSWVGYSIRLESSTSKTTMLTFVTNGIALRMLESGQGGQGSSFDEVTHIVIDEVHERTIESDFLLIVLKSLVKERPDLKVVLMSATLDAEKISAYFDGCPILQIPGRTFPVEVRYLEDAIEVTQWKISDDSPYAIRGRDKYSRGKTKIEWSEDTAPADDDDQEAIHENVKLGNRYSSDTAATIDLFNERLVPYELIIRLLEQVCLRDSSYWSYSSAILIFMPGMGEIRRLHELLMDHRDFNSEDRFVIYPLHSTIASDQQAAVFNIPPQGVRKIVIATNIAETGITIPDITCVIDTGRQREMRFDEKRQLSRLIETFVARSNAAQRRGRAGRVQPGLCFHLFTKARHDTKMAEHPDPEIMRLSLSDLALRIKILKVNLGNSIEDVLSRALDPPSPVNIQRAISALIEVRALTTSEEITPLGRLLSKMPVDVHLGKFLLTASLFRCLDPALTIAATLNSKSPFLTPFGKEDEAHRQKMSFRTENSDFLTLHNAFSSWRTACANGLAIARKLCRTAYLSYQNLQQIEELREQLFSYLVDASFIQVDRSIIRELNQNRGRGRTRFVTVPPELNCNAVNPLSIHAALCAGLYPKILSLERGKDGKDKFVTITNNQPVALHPSSINFGRKPKEFGVNYLCYFTIMQSRRLYAWETGPVDDLALLLLCGEADFKLMSDSVFVDRKIRYRMKPKSNVALKILRNQLGSLLASQFRGKPLSPSQVPWNDIAMTVLNKEKPPIEQDKKQEVTLVVNRIMP